MSMIKDGKEITNAFHYIQQLSNECKMLILKIDNYMAPDWINIKENNNTITTGVSKSLQVADRWIFQALFRSYENSKYEMCSRNKCIAITFWEDGLVEPIITAGEIVYSDVSKRAYWDLWHIWFTWSKQNFDSDGKYNSFQPEEHKYIKEATIFSMPLVEITGEEDLIEKIIMPLKNI